MTTRTTTTCDHCARALAQGQCIELRDHRSPLHAHFCDLDCLAAWAPGAAECRRKQDEAIVRADPWSIIPWAR